MTPAWAPEQLPVLCRRCGGAAQLLDAQSAACPYCGAREQLPADAVLRNIELRARLDAARNARGQLDGLSLALARMYEGRGGLLRVALPLGGFFGLVGAQQLVGAWGAATAAPEGLRACIALNAAAMSSMVWAIPGGVLAGLLVARRRYRRGVRPWLLARAPMADGAPARCRTCGAPITSAAQTVFVPCPYCQTQNLLVGEVFVDRARRLAEEAEQHHARLAGASAAASRVGAGLDGALYASFAAAWVLSVALAAVVQRAVCGWR